MVSILIYLTGDELGRETGVCPVETQELWVPFLGWYKYLHDVQIIVTGLVVVIPWPYTSETLV